MDTLCKNNDNHRGLAWRDKDSSGKGPYTLLCWPFLPKMEGNIRHCFQDESGLEREKRGLCKVCMMLKGLNYNMLGVLLKNSFWFDAISGAQPKIVQVA